jgi:hypothetical protein
MIIVGRDKWRKYSTIIVTDGFRRGRGSHGHAASSAPITPLRIKGEEEEAPMCWSKACAGDKIPDKFTFGRPKGAH